VLAESGIYQIRNTVNGKIYVGSSKHMETRWRQHRGALRSGIHRSKHLQRAWNSQGEDSFRFEPLITCASSMLIWYEQQFLDQLQPAYNNRKLADSNLGHVHDADTRARISAGMKKVTADPSWRQRMSAQQLGTKRSATTRKRLSENKKQCYIDKPQYRELLSVRATERADIARLEFQGATKTIQEWAEHYNIGHDTIRQRLEAGWSIEDALTKPTQKALIEYNGERKSLVDWAREYGLKAETLAQRLKKWDMHKALTTPVRTWGVK
jgi:group I intron endonuclease